jgi:hypothetical protein
MKNRKPLLSRLTVLAAICAVGFTALVTGRADSEDIDFSNLLIAEDAASEAALGETFFADSEAFFEKAMREMDLDAFEAAAKKIPHLFRYTEKGGLDANNPLCETFLDPDGNYGARGKIIASYLAEKLKHNASTALLAEDVVGMEKKPAICPNWRQFDTSMRTKFWVWSFAAMAAIESTCGHYAYRPVVGQKVAKGKKTKYAIGLLQMELNLRDRKWRSQASCRVTDKQITSDLWNLRCGIDIMEWQIMGLDSRPQIPLYTNEGVTIRSRKDYLRQSYWEKLNRPKGGEIGKLVRSFKPCYDAKLIRSPAPVPPLLRRPENPPYEHVPAKNVMPFTADNVQEQLELEYLFRQQAARSKRG